MKTILVSFALAAAACVPNPTDVSIDSVACSKGGTYTKYEGPNGVYFKTSDGQTFNCSPSDCARATESINNWCSSH